MPRGKSFRPCARCGHSINSHDQPQLADDPDRSPCEIPGCECPDFVYPEPVARRRVQGAIRAGDPDWSGRCLNCGSSPVVPQTGLCGPCTFGEAETAGGNW
jgi:hypothetical protein